MNDEIIELETKVAYLEKHLNELSDVIYQQQQLIDQLNKSVRLLQQASANEHIKRPQDEDKPPHY
jgi:uncharacterized coiled-coil protein SlyX